MKYSPSNLVFRESKKRDINNIVDIHNSNVLGKQDDIEKQGFVLEKINYNIVLNKIDILTEKYFVATDKTDSILGYIALKGRIDDNILLNVEWESAFNYKPILSDKYFYVSVVAIRPDILGKGVGQYLYCQSYLRYPNCVFTAFVATRPYRNQRSLDFHIKQGFSIVGQYKNNNFCGLNNYESKLFFKI